MDAKGLISEAVAIRCAPPPAKRRVPIQFDAWVVMSLSWYQSTTMLKCSLESQRKFMLESTTP